MLGIIDSGIGGLSVFQEIKNLLPKVNIIYFADRKNFPYGEKTEEELREIVSKGVEQLIALGAKVIIIACNSATVSTIDFIRGKYNIPIVGIEPAIKQAIEISKNMRIGMMATKRTITAQEYDSYSGKCKIYCVHNGGLIDNIENDFENVSDDSLRESIKVFVEKNVDTIVLGCTHFHFIKARLENLFPNICFLAPDEAVAKRTVGVLGEKMLEFDGRNDIFLVSGDKVKFGNSLKILLGVENADIRSI